MAQNLNYGTYEELPTGCEGCQPSGYKYCQDIVLWVRYMSGQI
jgi:hypothetical protein